MQALPLPTNQTRIGFHYYPDDKHYREADLVPFINDLTAFNNSWLILKNTLERAIPESFLELILKRGMEPVIWLDSPLQSGIDQNDAGLLFDTYARWGVHYVILFDRPNQKSAWSSSGWVQMDLVERFLDRFIPLANMAVKAGLLPIFPPLQPGGDFWDTTFLRSALEGLKRRGQTQLIQKLVLSAYSWIGEKSLNWGAGGPERWAAARPYMNVPGEEDHKGFRIFEWYEAISTSVLKEKLPILLLGVGFDSNHNPTIHGEMDTLSQTTRAQTLLSIIRLLNGEEMVEPGSTGNQLQPVSSNVIGCAFWLLSADADDGQLSNAWFKPDGTTEAVVPLFREWFMSQEKPSPKSPVSRDRTDKPIDHYLLLPLYEWGVSDWHLEVIRPFVKKYHPTIGFSISEAALASTITVIGGPQTFPDELLQSLRSSGADVTRISGDGTSIASQLTER